MSGGQNGRVAFTIQPIEDCFVVGPTHILWSQVIDDVSEDDSFAFDAGCRCAITT